jgi:Fe(3+) dicitrate transport protein
MKSKVFLLFFFLWFSQKVFGQKGLIYGQVKDNEGKPLPFAQLLLEKTGKTCQSDSAGKFRFEEMVFGEYLLLVQASGFGEKSYSLKLNKPVLELDVILSIKSKNLQAVEVKADSKSDFGMAQMKSVDQFGIYEGRKTEVVVLKNTTANLATNNPRQVFGKVTGLNIWESDGAGLQLGIGGRGLSPNRTANFNVRQNGYDISADALGYPESYYTPPTEALDRIEIIRGAASLQYGTQFGGLLNFKFKRGPLDKKLEFTSRQSMGSWGFFNSFNSVGGTTPNGKLNYYAFGQYKRGNGYRPNSGFEYGNGFISLDYKINEKLNLELEITKMYYLAQQPGGLTDKNFQDNPRQSFRSRNWFEVDWNMLAAIATYKFNSNTQLNIRNFSLLASRKSLGNLERINVIDFGGNRTLIEGVFQNLGNETRLLHRYGLGKKRHAFLVGTRVYKGYSTARQGDGNNAKGPDFQFLNPGNLENSDYRFPNFNFALFAENIFHLSDKLSLTPGIRFENIKTSSSGYYNVRTLDGAGNLVAQKRVEQSQSRNRSFLLAGLGISYKADTLLECYGNVSQNYRAINFSDLRIVNPNFVVDTNIMDEKGFTADLGIRGKKEGRFMYELTAFYLFYQGKIGQILRADRPPLFNDYRYRGNISDARNIGLECFAELELLQWNRLKTSAENAWHLSAFVNFAYVDAHYINTQDASIRNKKVEMVPPYMLRTGLTLRRKTFAITGQYSHIGQHYSDATNARRTATAVEGIIPSYSVLDISARYALGHFFFEASLNNAFDASYFTRRAESYPGPGILPSDGRAWFLTLGVKI